jgi:hypothetical protein
MNVTYSLQFFGNSPYDDTAPVDVFQPGKVTYVTSVVFSVSRFAADKPGKQRQECRKVSVTTNRGNQGVPSHQRGISLRL